MEAQARVVEQGNLMWPGRTGKERGRNGHQFTCRVAVVLLSCRLPLLPSSQLAFLLVLQVHRGLARVSVIHTRQVCPDFAHFWQSVIPMETEEGSIHCAARVRKTTCLDVKLVACTSLILFRE